MRLRAGEQWYSTGKRDHRANSEQAPRCHLSLVRLVNQEDVFHSAHEHVVANLRGLESDEFERQGTTRMLRLLCKSHYPHDKLTDLD